MTMNPSNAGLTDDERAVAASVVSIAETTRKYCLRILHRIGEKHRRLEKRGVADACESGRLACEAREVCRGYRLSFSDDYIDAIGLSRSKVFSDIRLFRLSEQYPDLLTALATVRAGYLLSAKATPPAVIEEVLSLAREQQKTVSENDVQNLIGKLQPTGSAARRVSTEQVTVAGATIVIRPGKDTSPRVVEALVEAIRRIAAKASRRSETSADDSDQSPSHPAS